MENQKDKTAGSIEEALMRELRFGGIDKDNLKELVGIVAGIHKGGLKRIKVFTKGIPYPDGLRVSGIIEAGEASRFVGEILLRTPRLGWFGAFPYGIPWPDFVRVNIDLGANGANIVTSNPMPSGF